MKREARPIQAMLQSALTTITSTETPSQTTKTFARTAVSWDWKWEPTGRETPQEALELAGMLNEAIAFASEILKGEPPRWLFLCGKSGAGKTHLARRLAAFINQWGEWAYNKHYRAVHDPGGQNPDLLYSYAQSGAVFVKWSHVIDSARDSDYELFRTARADYFKVIDDVGAEGLGQDRKPTAFVVNQLGKLCDGRLGKWTVFTSNYGIKEFAESFDTRISSRFLRDENITFETTARDYNAR